MAKYDAGWEDMSDYIVHFTKPAVGGTPSAYDNALSICADECIEARSPFGIGRSMVPHKDSQRVACFSEIPLHLLDRLVDRRGEYAIGFRKEIALSKGVGPIWYVEKDGPAQKAMYELMKHGKSDPHHPIWRATPMIDAMGEFGTSSYRFEWEREWRGLGDFHFKSIDAAFLILPDHLHEKAKLFFQQAEEDNRGPGYTCPLIDAKWGHNRIKKALGVS